MTWAIYLVVAGLAAALAAPLVLGGGRPLLAFAAVYSSAPAYMAALIFLAGLFDSLAKRRADWRTTARALRGVGAAMTAGGLMSVLGSPLLLHWAGASPSIARFDVPALAVGLIGAALIVLSTLLSQAALLQAEVDSFV